MFEQGQKRQPQDREVVALNSVEEMNPGSLQLIGADAGGHGGARSIEITIDKRFGKCSHREPRDRHVAKRNGSVSTYRDSRMQLMGLAAQRQDLVPRGRAISGLGKASLAQCQRLVAA